MITLSTLLPRSCPFQRRLVLIPLCALSEALLAPRFNAATLGCPRLPSAPPPLVPSGRKSAEKRNIYNFVEWFSGYLHFIFLLSLLYFHPPIVVPLTDALLAPILIPRTPLKEPPLELCCSLQFTIPSLRYAGWS